MNRLFSAFKSKRTRPKKAIRGDSIFSESRKRFLVIVVSAVFIVLFIRSITIIFIPPSAEILSGLAKRQYERQIELSPYRGPIFDRRGEPLAISIRKPSFFINPRVFSPEPAELQELSRLLQISISGLRTIQNRPGYFAWLKRKVDDPIALKIEALGIRGLHQVMEPARFYPAGSAASQLIGYVGIDNNGLMGLELSHENILSGEKTHALRSKDARGRVIFKTGSSAAPEESGQRLYLTIDRVVQEITEQALAKGVKEAEAKSGFAIVADPHTGRLLAIANYPPFDPNRRGIHDLSNTRNKAILDLFEPGSTLKPLVVAQALAEHKTSLYDIHDTENGLYREGRWRIRDNFPEEKMSTEEILIRSSNIGIYKIASLIGPESLYDTYRAFGIGSQHNLIGFPQQGVGRLQNWQNWRAVRFANISFGQGLVVNGIEMVQAYGAIANGGHLMRPLIIDRIENSQGVSQGPEVPRIIKRVMSAEVARKVRQTLAKVVEQGTGRNARMELYTSAGKTGTSEKVDPETRSYGPDLRIASFIGFAPVADPHLVIYILVDEPGRRPYYGGLWAAPVFREIAERSLHYLNVAPDRIGQYDPGYLARGLSTKAEQQ